MASSSFGGVHVELWRAQLRTLRTRDALTREELATAAGVAPATIKAYESGARQPSRELLTVLLDALKADVTSRASILAGAGYAPDGRIHYRKHPSEWYGFDEAVQAMVANPYPAHLNNEVMEVAAANVLMQRVWEVDFRTDQTGPFERSFLGMLTHQPVCDRLLNWEECVSHVLQLVKGHYGSDTAALLGSNAYFSAAVEYLIQGEPHYVQRFLALWATLPPKLYKLRFTYPITWRHTRAGTLNFHVFSNPATPDGALGFQDWIPADAATMAAIARLSAEEDGLLPFAQE